jgi:hypothetical protein
MSLQALAEFFNTIREEDGNLDCMANNIIVCIYNASSKYLMWEIDNYEQ